MFPSVVSKLIPPAILLLASMTLLNMWKGKAGYSTFSFVLLSPVISRTEAQCDSASRPVSLDWYRPNATTINNLTAVINGTGVFGFQFSAVTPSDVPYQTYNWCNMPHVRPQEYTVLPSEYKLEYVEVVCPLSLSSAQSLIPQIHRHHKRTPYADNTFPRETYTWDCDDESLLFYGFPVPDSRSAQVAWSVYTSPSNPFAPAGFNGSCQFPQITGQGLNDSRVHGSDLYGVYGGLLQFLPSDFESTKVTYRVTNNVITSEVAGQLILGMYPSSAQAIVSVGIQPDSVDSLEPNYECPASDDLRGSYGVGSDAANWTRHLNESADLFSKLDSVSGVNETDSDWHNWFDHYYDNLSARLCHQKPLPCSASNDSLCITGEDAEAVFRRGQYEYSFIYRDSPDSLPASTASFGVWIAELASNLRAVITGESEVIYRHNIAHDGSVSRLLSILQIDVMVWPGMGSEVVFELYKRDQCHFLRVLWGGRVLRSSNPSLGLMHLVPVERLLGYIDGLVGRNAEKVPSLCEGS